MTACNLLAQILCSDTHVKARVPPENHINTTVVIHEKDKLLATKTSHSSINNSTARAGRAHLQHDRCTTMLDVCFCPVPTTCIVIVFAVGFGPPTVQQASRLQRLHPGGLDPAHAAATQWRKYQQRAALRDTFVAEMDVVV